MVSAKGMLLVPIVSLPLCLCAFAKESSHTGRVSITSTRPPSFSKPVSQLATAKQFRSPEFIKWVDELKEPYRVHRKLWEHCYVAQVLKTKGLLRPGKRGIGFGVGTEPLPALFAKYGCRVIASDQDFSSANKQGWAQTEQFATCKATLNAKGICPPGAFDSLVDLRRINMKSIDRAYTGKADFVWSCCCFEHLGSIKAGLEFVKKSLRCLKPGGVAIHTTELNLSSAHHTLSRGGTVLFRKRDIEKVAREVAAMGYKVSRINFFAGGEKIDHFVDVPPYKADPHLKLQISRYTSTSMGLIIQKPFKNSHRH
jgi:SAM-dependent methyltransferase